MVVANQEVVGCGCVFVSGAPPTSPPKKKQNKCVLVLVFSFSTKKKEGLPKEKHTHLCPLRSLGKLLRRCARAVRRTWFFTALHSVPARSATGDSADSVGSLGNLGPPVVPFCPFWGESSPAKIDYSKKGTLILTSLLEDLVMFTPYQSTLPFA